MTLSHELIIVFVLKNLLKIHPFSFHIKDNVKFQIKRPLPPFNMSSEVNKLKIFSTLQKT